MDAQGGRITCMGKHSPRTLQAVSIKFTYNLYIKKHKVTHYDSDLLKNVQLR